MILFQQMIVLFFIMIVGFLCRKKNIIDDGTSRKISALVVNVANPALILSSGINQESVIEGMELIKIFGLALGVYAFLIIVAFIIPAVLKIDADIRGVYRVMTIFSNIGFMGFPLISAVYGKTALLYASLFLIPYNVLIYTYGIATLKKPESGHLTKEVNRDVQGFSIMDVMKKICNIGVVSCVISLIFYISRIHVPVVFVSTVTYLSNLTAPLSMMIIGSSIAQIKLRELFTDWKLIVFSVVKLIAIPFIGVSLVKYLGINTDLTGVILIMLATPVGSMTVMLAQQFEGNYELASKGVTLTTILSIITIPFVSLLLGI